MQKKARIEGRAKRNMVWVAMTLAVAAISATAAAVYFGACAALEGMPDRWNDGN